MGKLHTISPGHIGDTLPTLWRANHAAQGRPALRRQKAGCAAIGGDHQFFNQLPCAVLRLLTDVDNAFRGKHRTGLKRLELQRTCSPPQHAQLLSQLVLHAQLGGHPLDLPGWLWQVRLPLDPGGHGVVGQLGLVSDGGAVDGRLHQNTIVAEHHLDDDRQPVLIGVERGQIGAQALRKHREDPCRGVDRCGVVSRVVIDGRGLRNQSIHVRHRHTNANLLPIDHLNHRELIQVLRVIVVDGAPGHPPQILHRLPDIHRRPHQACDLSVHRLRKLWLQTSAEHGPGCDRRQTGTMVGQCVAHELPLCGCPILRQDRAPGKP